MNRKNILTPLKQKLAAYRDTVNLYLTPYQDFNDSAYPNLSNIDLEEIFRSENYLEGWKKLKQLDALLAIPDGTGGVNNGDRQALYYLLRHFKPKTVLEIGTHIGASTTYMATALSHNSNFDPKDTQLVTLDIRDVNDETKKPWLEHNSKHSPREILKQLGLDKLVKFKQMSSLDFAKTSKEKFDFIFIDGDHSGSFVYKEIAALVPILKSGSIVITHDFFPDMKPLWKNQGVIVGPQLAVNRYIKEGKKIKAIPLNDLPWNTKHDSHKTSLALLSYSP